MQPDEEVEPAFVPEDEREEEPAEQPPTSTCTLGGMSLPSGLAARINNMAPQGRLARMTGGLRAPAAGWVEKQKDNARARTTSLKKEIEARDQDWKKEVEGAEQKGVRRAEAEAAWAEAGAARARREEQKAAAQRRLAAQQERMQSSSWVEKQKEQARKRFVAQQEQMQGEMALIEQEQIDIELERRRRLGMPTPELPDRPAVQKPAPVQRSPPNQSSSPPRSLEAKQARLAARQSQMKAPKQQRSGAQLEAQLADAMQELMMDEPVEADMADVDAEKKAQLEQQMAALISQLGGSQNCRNAQ